MMTMKNASAATVNIDLPRCTTMHPNGFGFSLSFPNTSVSFLTGAPPAERALLRVAVPDPPPAAAAPAAPLASSNAADSEPWAPPLGPPRPPAARLGPDVGLLSAPLVDEAAAAARMADALPASLAPPPVSRALSGGRGGRLGGLPEGRLGPPPPCCSRSDTPVTTSSKSSILFPLKSSVPVVKKQ